VKGKIYVLGGLQRPSPTSDFPWYAVGDSFVYDPLTDKWTPLAPMPPGTERGSGAIVAYEQKIYVAGGTFCHEGFEGQCFTDSERNRFFSVYDTVTNTWQQLPDLPQPRDHVPGAVLGNSLYLFGGRDDNVDSTFSDVFAYNLKTGTWRTRAPMPTARSEAWLGVVGEKVHLIGGSGNVANETGTFDDHEAYDAEHDRWTVLPPMPVPRHGPATAVIGGSIYLPGGALTETLGTVDTFDRFTPP
jgi:N-acetylneuraminic acid mutarotase